MRAVFMGTPALAASVLERLADVHEVAAVFTRPDAVRGRGKALVASPVKSAALERGIPVHEAKSLDDPEYARSIEELAPDVICVAAYGAILPRTILELPRLGCLNVHTSLLPRWRGAAPIERAILEHDEFTGVCIMKMEEGLDTGPVCACEKVAVQGAYVDELSQQLARLGADMLVKAIAAIDAGTATWKPQASEGATYARKLSKRELDWACDDDSRDLVAKVRASSASRPSRVEIAGKTVAVERASVCEGDDTFSRVAVGEVAFIEKRLLAGTREGVVEIERVRPAGKKSMEGHAFASGIQGIKNTQVNWGTPC